jgi:hypothetical protein
MSPNELKRYFPNASASTLRANSAASLPASDKEPTQGGALERVSKGKKAGSGSPITRIGLAFCVYAVRPADVDGWDLKEIIDALSGAQILDGDGWDRFYIAGIYSEKVQKKSEERTEITILYPHPATEPTAPAMTPRQALIEKLWLTARHTWNRMAFDVFCETLSDEDLQKQIQVGV